MKRFGRPEAPVLPTVAYGPKPNHTYVTPRTPACDQTKISEESAYPSPASATFL